MASYLETSIDQHQLTIKPIKPLGGQGLIEIGGYLRDGGLLIVIYCRKDNGISSP